MRDIGRKRIGQVLHVMGEREEIFLPPSLQFTDHIKGSLPLMPHLRIDFLLIGVVLDWDLPL